MRWLVLLFVVLPLVDLYFLLEIGTWFGLPATVVLTVLTGLVGAWLVRREGRRVWLAWRKALDGMTVPEHGLVEAALVLLGGVLLVTPGVMTDLVGIVLILPWSRRRIAGYVRAGIDRRLATGALRVAVMGRAPPTGETAPHREETVETHGEVVERAAPER